jgi:hypothetical protein
MELEELKTMWQENEARMNRMAKLNLKTIELIQSQKVISALKPVLWQRIIELVFHSLAIVLLSMFFVYNINQVPYAISALILILFYGLLFVNCFKQIRVIQSISGENDVLSMQRSLGQIQTYILNFIRLSVLCIPAFLSFPVVVSKALNDLGIDIFGNFDLVERTNGNWWSIERITFFVFIPMGIWFYRRVTAENAHIPWVARIIRKGTSARVANATGYLNELNELKTSHV